MSVKDTIREDKVGMRWFRTAATTLSSITAALIIIWGGLIWLVEPRLYEWAQLLVNSATVDIRENIEESDKQIDILQKSVELLNENITILSDNFQQRTAPAWRFDPVATEISDGGIGDTIEITSAGYKLADCGVPVVDVYFRDGRQTYHRFVEVSILGDDQRGIALPVDPLRRQALRYTAVIPEDDNVTAGRATGFISIVYPDTCPMVAPAVTGPLQFRILKGD